MIDGGGAGAAVKGSHGEPLCGGNVPRPHCVRVNALVRVKLVKDTRSTHITCYNCVQIYNCKIESTKHI